MQAPRWGGIAEWGADNAGMTEEWALRQAVITSPDDDLPRLVYADWLDDAGDPARAEFIRAQVQLATVPPWEPLAVQTKYRRPEWLTN